MKKYAVALSVVGVAIMSLGLYLSFSSGPEDTHVVPQTGPKESQQNADMGNPASSFCVQAGGTLEKIVKDAHEVMDCVFPSGERCEEWALFRGECDIENVSKTLHYTDGTSTVTIIYRLFNNTALVDAEYMDMRQVAVLATTPEKSCVLCFSRWFRKILGISK